MQYFGVAGAGPSNAGAAAAGAAPAPARELLPASAAAAGSTPAPVLPDNLGLYADSPADRFHVLGAEPTDFEDGAVVFLTGAADAPVLKDPFSVGAEYELCDLWLHPTDDGCGYVVGMRRSSRTGSGDTQSS